MYPLFFVILWPGTICRNVFDVSASWVRRGIVYEGFSGMKFPFIFLLGGPKCSLMLGKSADGI